MTAAIHSSAAVGMNLVGFVEATELGSSPFRIDVDGRPYVPTGDGGIVLGVRLGDGAFALAGDHVAPGATLIHPDPAARHALTAFSCIGNEVVVRSGAAAGAVGRVLGKRGESGRVVVVLEQEVLQVLGPGDRVSVRGFGQGATLPVSLHDAGAVLMNIDPALVPGIGVELGKRISATVRAEVPSRLIGNGIGRPAQLWDVDLSVTGVDAAAWELSRLALGDLVAVRDLDVRHNIGHRRGWTTIGVIVHGSSPQPGHGPGLTPFLCTPTNLLDLDIDGREHRGVTIDRLQFERG